MFELINSGFDYNSICYMMLPKNLKLTKIERSFRFGIHTNSKKYTSPKLVFYVQSNY